MEEELAQRFYDKLINKEGNPGVILTQFYCSYYGFAFNTNLIGQFGKLIKLYGRNLTYMAMLDLFGLETIDHKNIAGLLTYLVKKRFAEKSLISETKDLSKDLDEYTKDIERTRKIKFKELRDPFNVE